MLSLYILPNRALLWPRHSRYSLLRPSSLTDIAYYTHNTTSVTLFRQPVRASNKPTSTANTKTKHTNYSILKQTYTLVPLKYIYVWSQAIRDLDREIRFRSLCIWYLHIGILHILLLPITSFFLSTFFLLSSAFFFAVLVLLLLCYCFGLPTFAFFVWCFYFFSAGFRLFDAIQLAHIDISHGSFISFYCHSQNNLHPICGIITHVFFNFFFHSNSYWNLFSLCNVSLDWLIRLLVRYSLGEFEWAKKLEQNELQNRIEKNCLLQKSENYANSKKRNFRRVMLDLHFSFHRFLPIESNSREWVCSFYENGNKTHILMLHFDFYVGAFDARIKGH